MENQSVRSKLINDVIFKDPPIVLIAGPAAMLCFILVLIALTSYVPLPKKIEMNNVTVHQTANEIILDAVIRKENGGSLKPQELLILRAVPFQGRMIEIKGEIILTSSKNISISLPNEENTTVLLQALRNDSTQIFGVVYEMTLFQKISAQIKNFIRSSFRW